MPRSNNDEMIDTGEFANLTTDKATIELYHAIHQISLMTKGIPYMVPRTGQPTGLGKIWAWFKGALKHAAETADKIRIE